MTRRLLPGSLEASIRRFDRRACGWFWLLAVVGAALGLGIPSLGPLLTLPVVVIALLLARRPSIRRWAFGLATGVGSVLLLVAYVQRQGPGTTCWRTATATGCDQHLDPRPWLAFGILAVLAGLIGQIRSNRRRGPT